MRLQLPPWANPWLLGAIALSMLLHCFILYVPPAATVFSVVPLNGSEWGAVFWLSFPVILVDEVLKYLTRCACCLLAMPECFASMVMVRPAATISFTRTLPFFYMHSSALHAADLELLRAPCLYAHACSSCIDGYCSSAQHGKELVIMPPACHERRHCVGGVGSGRASTGIVERVARMLPRRLRQSAALEMTLPQHRYSGDTAAANSGKAHL